MDTCKTTTTNSNYDHNTKMQNETNCLAEEVVVITGMAGNFPACKDVQEYADNLINGMDMVTPSKWPGSPKRIGQLLDIDKFDSSFFGVPYEVANRACPMIRIFLEKAIEAIFDAGLNPKDLEGTRTGVFIGAGLSETEILRTNKENFIGSTRSFIANRLSYYLKLRGPSYICDTACSSSLYALEHAYRAIRLGECDTAIVGGTNLCLNANVTYQFFSLGVLSIDGASKPFDESANGYARAEANCALVLQKSKDAKRIYAKIVHIKSNSDGYKENGLLFPSEEMQAQCLKECYEEANIHPNEITYIEAHGTGTSVGDPVEVNSLDEVICKKRDKPLLIGSNKSNIGHTETASGLCALLKCLIAFETGFIPPTIHYTNPRKDIKGIHEGRIKVVTENTPLPKGKCIFGINNFGFGGSNCHIIISNFEKNKVNNGIPEDNLPRLVCVSGRVPEAITKMLDKVSAKKTFDAEFVRLLHDVFRYNIDSHNFRGFSIVSKNGEVVRSQALSLEKNPQMFFEFCDIDSTLATTADQLLQIPIFATTIQKIRNILDLKNINIVKIVSKNGQKTLKEQILGHIAVQMGLVDLFKIINLEPTFVFGYGINELVTAYQDGILSLSQVLEMALVVINLCENLPMVSVYIAESNPDSITEILTMKDIRVEALSKNKCIVYCSTDISDKFQNIIRSNEIKIQSLGLKVDNKSFLQKEILMKHFDKIIAKPKKWSRKHLLSPNQVADSQYFANYFMAPFNYKALQKGITKSTIILKFGSSKLELLMEETCLSPENCLEIISTENALINHLKVLGRLYIKGFSMKLSNMYPEVQFPVSRTTPYLSNLVKWHHEKKWFTITGELLVTSSIEEQTFLFNANQVDRLYYDGHNIDGRNLFPAAGYILLVWKALAELHNKLFERMKVVISNCRFIRATTIPKEGVFKLTVMIQKGSGNFEISENRIPVVNGNIRGFIDDFDSLMTWDENDNYMKDFKMNTKDIYKELRLRGYNYTGGFKGIKECNVEATNGLIKWDYNWVTFMDSMFQMKILQLDSRLLYVPTVVSQITIDTVQHAQCIESLGEDPCLPVKIHREANIISSGGIQVQGLKASSIARRKDLSDPVLEKHQFVANFNNKTFTLEKAIRVDVQLLLENAFSAKLKIVEVIDEVTDRKTKPLAPIVNDALNDEPVVKAEVVILSKTKDYENCDKISIENKPLLSEKDCNLIIGSKLLSRPTVLNEAFQSLKNNSYILSREPNDFNLNDLNSNNVNIITSFNFENESLLLLSKVKKVNNHEVIDISNKNDFSWLEFLKTSIKRDCNIVLLSQGDEVNGILGLVNCLRRELNPEKLKCVFIMDPKAPPFNINDTFYSKQLNRNMAINIYKDGQWGTYRHLKLESENVLNCDHSFVNINSPGDLTSLTWVQGPLRRKKQPNQGNSLVEIYYGALNFRDVMTASGKINVDVITTNRLLQSCVQGFEFTGRLQSGERVMGMANSGALSTLIEADDDLLWRIPSAWSMKEAATVPVCYCTAIWSMIKIGKMKKGDKVLIHSGTGGVGQAAINLAIYTGCTVFTTVGTPEKREFLKKQFPQLKDSHIGYSRDLSFLPQIMKETNGKGVDIVLNSLAEDKLFASVRCLAQNGRFLEIGKFDIANNNALKLLLLKKNVSFHGVMLDQLMDSGADCKKTLWKIMSDYLYSEAVKPLNINLFEAKDIEKAFRFMASGKHIGKVLIEIRNEDTGENKNIDLIFPKTDPRYYCEKENTSIIVGGLGGFGLELADWLIIRGARNIVLTSRKGIQNGYQAYRIKIWKSYGVKVVISTDDVTTKEGCTELLRKANELGKVEAIFNLAVILKDALIENQDEESFKTSFAPKATATRHLDELSRKMCPNLRKFVIFSSVSCGRGNEGQTNYGMANSVMERICEKRKQEGYPGLAIQWGAVGDVGLVADMQEEHKELEIGGTLQQRITSCFNVLDNFLMQESAAVVASMVVAEKRAEGTGNMVDVVAGILGVKDLKDVSHHIPFPEMGMDSMTAVEIKQTLERDYDVFLTPEDIRRMTFEKLLEIQEKQFSQDQTETVTEVLEGMDLLLRLIGEEEVNNKPILELNSKLKANEDKNSVLFFSGIEGVALTFELLVQNLYVKSYGIQYGCFYEKNTIRELAQSMIPYIKEKLPSKSFKFVAYSFGVLFALEVVSVLECLGYKGTLICLDGAPKFIKHLTSLLEVDSDDKLQTSIICKMLSMRIKLEDIETIKVPLLNSKSIDERLTIAQNLVDQKLKNEIPISPSHLRQLFVGIYKRIRGVITYSPSFTKINSKVVLIKSMFSSAHVPGLAADYGLSEVCGQNVEVFEVKGNHVTILESPEVAEYINEQFAKNEH